MDQLVLPAVHGALVHVAEVSDLKAALAYSNHNTIMPFADVILAKIHEGAIFRVALDLSVSYAVEI